jgi:hypothetical protein
MEHKSLGRERRRRRMFLKLTRSTLRALKFSLRVSTKLGREERSLFFFWSLKMQIGKKIE